MNAPCDYKQSFLIFKPAYRGWDPLMLLMTDQCQWVGLRGIWYKRYREYTDVNLRYSTDFEVTV